jgi:biotin operon repressor
MLTDFITIMQNHIGKANAISGEDLAKALGTSPREMRKMTDSLIDEGISLCSHPAHGYWIAANAAEVEATCQFHRSRALHELDKEAKLRKLTLPDLLGQLHLRT